MIRAMKTTIKPAQRHRTIELMNGDGLKRMNIFYFQLTSPLGTELQFRKRKILH